jgi:hypothetical protein
MEDARDYMSHDKSDKRPRQLPPAPLLFAWDHYPSLGNEIWKSDANEYAVSHGWPRIHMKRHSSSFTGDAHKRHG